MPRVDVHQHAWPDALVEELRRRSVSPRIVDDTLLLDGEPDFALVPGDHVLSERRTIDEGDRIDLALVSLSSPLGIETLAPDQAAPLLDAWHAFAADLGPGHGLWAAVNLVDPDLDALRTTLAQPSVCGLQVPATALLDPAALTRLAPVLAVVEAAGRPVLVHPGPAPAAPISGATLPGWWPALTSYTAQLTAAWFAWHVAGRALLPDLRICFVALAGLAPLHHERLAARGGAFGAVDRHVYYDTSSYGSRAVDAVIRVVGVDPIVHGSDRPYALPRDPGLGDAFSQALYITNPHHLLNGGTR
ncbi:amidohydrolase family protein [Nocardioides sp.]|uniref:amidohydrolase family protein n=1 Tax=Nocardioides sp. TaxID=35761 RepID=UPI00271D3914|nr:amidohydrolase family protein [Nocardioides sp.]MDO9457788.1 amidohydrolase family protein [Nocardioides sp.]